MEGTTVLVTIKEEDQSHTAKAPESPYPYKGTLLHFARGGLDLGNDGDFEMAVRKFSATYEYTKRNFYLAFRAYGQGLDTYGQRVSFESMDDVKDAYELEHLLRSDAWTLPLAPNGTKVPLSTVMDIWAIDEKTIRFVKKNKDQSGGYDRMRYSMWSQDTKDSCHFYRMNDDLSDDTTLMDMPIDNDGVPYVITDEDIEQDLVHQIDKDLGHPATGDSSIMRATRPDNEVYVDMDISGMLVRPTTLDLHCPDLLQSNYDSEPMCHRPGRIFTAPLCQDVNERHVIHAEPKVLTYHTLKGGMHYSGLFDVAIHCPPEDMPYCPTVKNAYIILHLRKSRNSQPSAKRVHELFGRN